MKIHFIGIGGIGVSALAQYYLEKGHKVSGSDLVSSKITDALRKKGAKLLIGKHKAKNLPSDVDLVIYSQAIPPTNPELKKARKLKIVNCKLKIKSYPEALGELTKKHWTIAVSGTHGKGTTTAMISLILIKAGFNPTVILGTKLREFGDSNFRMGKSKYLVIEADEYRGAFLNYWPKIIVLTNIEKEHMDYFKNLKHILKVYAKYISHLSQEGVLIANKDDKNISKLKTQILKLHLRTQNYSLKQKEARKLRKILKIPGDHMVSDALAALTTARILKISDKISFKALSQYRGAWRRFEIKSLKIENCKLKIISDYAHHPTEIRVTLQAAREKFPKKKIWCIFQPHQYQRTHYLFPDFVKVFKEAPIDKIFITDIYSVAGREKKEIKEKVSSKKLVSAINRENVFYLPKNKIFDNLRKNLKDGEVVIIMGAGDIYKDIYNKYKSKNQIEK